MVRPVLRAAVLLVTPLLAGWLGFAGDVYAVPVFGLAALLSVVAILPRLRRDGWRAPPLLGAGLGWVVVLTLAFWLGGQMCNVALRALCDDLDLEIERCGRGCPRSGDRGLPGLLGGHPAVRDVAVTRSDSDDAFVRVTPRYPMRGALLVRSLRAGSGPPMVGPCIRAFHRGWYIVTPCRADS
jgi:hypothetical protein